LRNPKALADLEQMAARVSQAARRRNGFRRQFNRPMGQSLEQARFGLARRARWATSSTDASQQIHQRNEDLDKLTHGADTWPMPSARCETKSAKQWAGTAG